ncbi:hypothetical protein [Massilia antarctica]|uniref:hypothetical protein n=1 Tax=Massilia antarctica TaxID=2765360 RepID=UPI00226ED275|nr:hypothetical protein [Massilia sp. H27-R4]MCY0910908.1 hypothetical protein [Massilia sp. H27-R4]
MKPEHTRPFSLEHARAGAPYRCRDTQEATVYKWDGRDTKYPLVGCIGANDQPVSWRANGQRAGGVECTLDLVMTPLGFIDGKPVFVGDVLIDPSGTPFVPGPSNSGHLAGCIWPASAPVYPETSVSYQELSLVALNANSTPLYASASQLHAIANAAIRRVIDDGQVVRKDDHEAALNYLGEHLRGIAIQRDDLRDLAIAEAVHRAHVNGQYSIPGAWDIDLAALIATVKW